MLANLRPRIRFSTLLVSDVDTDKDDATDSAPVEDSECRLLTEEATEAAPPVEARDERAAPYLSKGVDPEWFTTAPPVDSRLAGSVGSADGVAFGS